MEVRPDDMPETNDLSPWVHPKAKNWFYALFRKSNLAIALEDELRKPEEQLTPAIMRMILAFGVLLGRPEIWPENERDILEAIVDKAKQVSQNPPKSASGKPLTLAEHQTYSHTTAELAYEIELLRRRLGISNRKTPVGTPKSWEPFWE